MNIDQLSEKYTYEELACAMYRKGTREGYSKVTDKTKWREPVMAQKLGHKAHKKISAGKNSEKYGSDALDETSGTYAEYKTKALNDEDLDRLFQRPTKNGNKRTTMMKVAGIYNGAYKAGAIESYSKIDHYFGLFYEERCVMIIKPNVDEVVKQLESGLIEQQIKGGSTNLNTVSIDLGHKNIYSIAYKDEEFFKHNDEKKLFLD